MNISRRPAKQFLYNNLYRAFKLSAGKKVGIDIACGYMYFRNRFLTERYIGVDLDARRIEEGVASHPENTEGVVCKIEDMPDDLQGDFVACIQAIGANQHFIVDNTMTCVGKLVSATGSGGTLVFNVGHLSAHHHADIKALLDHNFDEIEVVSYGAFNGETFQVVSLFLSYAMQLLPFLRSSSAMKKYLYICQSKK